MMKEWIRVETTHIEGILWYMDVVGGRLYKQVELSAAVHDEFGDLIEQPVTSSICFVPVDC